MTRISCLLLVTVLALHAGCSGGKAAILLADRRAINAKIERSDELAIYVKLTPAVENRMSRISRPPAAADTECEEYDGFCAEESCEQEEGFQAAAEKRGCPQLCCVPEGEDFSDRREASPAAPTDPGRIARSDIVEIDHPGNALAIAGGILTVAGAAVVGIGFAIRPSGDAEDDQSAGFGNVLAGVVAAIGGVAACTGIGIGGAGLASWIRSRSAAAPPAPTSPVAGRAALSFLGVAPVAGGERDLKGVFVGFQF